MSIMDIVEVWNMQSNTQQQTTFQLKNAGFFKVADNVWCYEQVCLVQPFNLAQNLMANLHIARVGSRFYSQIKFKNK